MDFDIALGKLEREQNKLRKKALQQKETKERSNRLAKKRQKEYELKKEKQEKEKLKLQKIENYMIQCNASLKRKSIGDKEQVMLKVQRIEGDADKIKLPDSILSNIINENNGEMTSGPLMFRLGIINPNYKFPASNELKNMMERPEEENDDDDMDDNLQPFRAELNQKYVTYTHAGVMEFTMEEGCVGLPPSVAKRLSIPEADDKIIHVEVSRVTLPKGAECTIIPTKSAIQNGFYNLKDVKSVLEQSIVRTRTTLSIGDTLHGWYRGIQYDLEVESLLPNGFGAISCIDTDITLHINSLKSNEDDLTKSSSSSKLAPSINSPAKVMKPESNQPQVSQPPQPTTKLPLNPSEIKGLLEEPPIDQTQNICQIQIRSRDGQSIKRRFDICKNTLSDVFSFVSKSLSLEQNFQLVTRFPRNVYGKNDNGVLMDIGFVQGQQLLMIEMMS